MGDQEGKSIDFGAVAFVDDTVAYASDCMLNGLYRIDIKTQNAKFISLFPNEELNKRGLHLYALTVNNKIYFIPASGNYISVLNINNESIESIAIPNVKQSNIYYKRMYKFAYAVKYDSDILIIPSTYSGVVRLNTQNNQVSVLNDWIPSDGFFFRRTFLSVKNKVYVLSCMNNNVLVFDMSSGRGYMRKIGNSKGYIASMYVDGDIIMSDVNGKTISRWNLDNDDTTEYKNNVNDFVGNELSFSKIYKHGDKYYLVPNKSNMMLEMDEKGTITKSNILLFDNTDGTWLSFESDEYLYFKVHRGRCIERYRVSKITNEILPINFVLNSESSRREQQICEKTIIDGTAIYESSSFSLLDFIKGV